MPENGVADFLIIGAGASGMVAAVSCGEYIKENNKKARIVLLEKNRRPGKKLLATGNGRCNLSNVNAVPGLTGRFYFGNNQDFIKTVIENFDYKKTIDFFERQGIVTFIDEEGKIFPYCKQAYSVVDILEKRLEELGIQVVKCCEVQNVTKDGLFNVRGTKKYYDGEFMYKKEQVEFCAENLLLSTGGKASPKLSSDGYGYPIAKSLGHCVTNIYPSIARLKTKTDINKELDGLKWDAKIILKELDISSQKEKSLLESRGEVLFTKYGLSGPASLRLARHVGNDRGKRHFALVDFLPDYDPGKLSYLINKRFNTMGYRPAIRLLTGVLPFELAKSLGTKVFSENDKISSLTPGGVKKIISLIKRYPFEITGTTGWENAQVTAGGVVCEEVSAKTCESFLCKGLYFTGEILDVDGECGGFNLQFAWASGFIAGKSVAEKMVGKNQDK